MAADCWGKQSPPGSGWPPSLQSGPGTTFWLHAIFLDWCCSCRSMLVLLLCCSGLSLGIWIMRQNLIGETRKHIWVWCLENCSDLPWTNKMNAAISTLRCRLCLVSKDSSNIWKKKMFFFLPSWFHLSQKYMNADAYECTALQLLFHRSYHSIYPQFLLCVDAFTLLCWRSVTKTELMVP